MFGSCGFFEVGQQECDYAEQRHVGTDMIDRLDAVAVGESAEHGRCHTAHSEGKSEKQSGDHAEF